MRVWNHLGPGNSGVPGSGMWMALESWLWAGSVLCAAQRSWFRSYGMKRTKGWDVRIPLPTVATPIPPPHSSPAEVNEVEPTSEAGRPRARSSQQRAVGWLGALHGDYSSKSLSFYLSPAKVYFFSSSFIYSSALQIRSVRRRWSW